MRKSQRLILVRIEKLQTIPCSGAIQGNPQR